MNIIATLPLCGNGFISFYFFALSFQFPLFHADGFDRADIDANAAIHTGVGVDFGLVFDHADSLARALADARLTTGALCFIHFRWH